ncbi:MAG TPA: MFS transporter [Gaiellaceae bacterium]|nr:MFS transporter [Gaiellaceae bacterium]
MRGNRDFRRFWTGQTISLFGDQITSLAVPLAGVLVLHAGPAQMGYLTAANLAPYLLFSLHAGAWVDRRGRRRQVMIAADLGRAALIAAVPVAYAFGSLTLAQLYVVAFLTGALSMLFFVSQSTLFVSLVPREDYVEANSFLHGSRAFSFAAGPPAGGLLVQLLTAPYALVVDAVSFLVSAVFLRRIDPLEPPTSTDESGRVIAGARFIRRSPVIRASLGATATINFFNFAFFALFILYATRYLHVGPGLLGVVLGAGAVGGLLGSVLTPRLGRRIGIGPAFLAGCILFPAPIVLVPLAGGPKPLVLALLFLAEFGSGLGVMVLDISAASIFAALIPNELRARVSGAYLVVNNGIRPLGSLFGGALGSAIGVRNTLWIVTVGAIAGFLWLLPSPVLGLKDLPEPDFAD